VEERKAIPRILGIGWWWLVLAEFCGWAAGKSLHIPAFIPPLGAFWILGQLIWLKRAEPRSRAIYFYFGTGLVGEIVFGYRDFSKLPTWAANFFVWVFFALAFTTIAVFWREMAKTFKEIDPLRLDFQGVRMCMWTFVFNSFYTQYYFHRLYKSQQGDAMLIRPGSR
jgi:hypothetical protein